MTATWNILIFCFKIKRHFLWKKTWKIEWFFLLHWSKKNASFHWISEIYEERILKSPLLKIHVIFNKYMQMSFWTKFSLISKSKIHEKIKIKIYTNKFKTLKYIYFRKFCVLQNNWSFFVLLHFRFFFFNQFCLLKSSLFIVFQ